MSTKICTLLMALTFVNLSFSKAQGPKEEQTTIEETPTLKIGEPMPNAYLEMYGYSSSSSKISDFRGKALILDFWATWCRPCVRDLPKLDSIQKANKEDLNIVLVTRESKNVVDSFLKNIQSSISIGIPSAVNNNYLLQLFSIKSLPQQVWIDKNGYVQAITYGEYLTASNIKDLISGQKPNVPLKKGGMRKKLPQAGKPIFSQPALKLEESAIVGYSILTKYTDTFMAAAGGDGPGQQEWGSAKTKLLFTNMPPSVLYSIAYAPLLEDAFFALKERIIFATKDSLKYHYPANVTNMEAQEWNYSNAYCYDIRVPLRDTTRILEYMRFDLNKYFPLNPEIVTKEKKCLQLSLANPKPSFSSKGGKQKRTFSQYYIKYENISIRQLFTDLNILLAGKTPLVNNITYKGNIDLELKGDLGNLEGISKALTFYNITTEVTTKAFKQLILTDK